MFRTFVAIALGAVAALVAAGPAASALELTSASFANGAPIPSDFVCRQKGGKNRMPDLSWSGVPPGTQSLAVIVDDPDARPIAGYTWVHMNLFNVSPDTPRIGHGITVAGAKYGRNHNGNRRYDGPCPPRGNHTYVFAVYALSGMVQPIPDKVDRARFERDFKALIIGKAEYTGTRR